MAQHTPGPWRATRLGSFRFSVSSLHSTEDDPLPVALCDTMDCDQKGEAYRQCKANAALIEAAPDLLAALRAIVMQANQGVVLERDACTQQARAAIAKAEGV